MKKKPDYTVLLKGKLLILAREGNSVITTLIWFVAYLSWRYSLMHTELLLQYLLCMTEDLWYREI